MSHLADADAEYIVIVKYGKAKGERFQRVLANSNEAEMMFDEETFSLWKISDN